MPAKKAGGKKTAAKPAAKAAPAKAAAAPKAAPASGGKSVYVKNLNFPGLNHETVKATFKSCGAVKQIKLRRKKYCILHFGDAGGASKAKELNGKVIKGNKITVESAKRGPEAERSETCTSVFVGGLTKSVRKDARAALKKSFAACGNVQKVRTYTTSGGMHAFVYFGDNASAKKAVNSMDRKELGKPFGSRAVSVRFSVRTKKADQAKEKTRQKRIAAKKSKRSEKAKAK